MLKTITKIAIPCFVILVILSGPSLLNAQGDNEDSSGNSNGRRNEPSREISGEIAEFIRGNNEFSLEIYRNLVEETEGNLFLSTNAVFTGVSVLYPGATGDTARQIAGTMRFPLKKTGELGGGFRGFLEMTAVPFPGSEEAKDFELKMAHSLWGMKDLEFLPQYFQTVKNEFKSEVGTVDFGNSESAAKAINEWAANTTKNRVKEIISPKGINQLSTLVLTNSVYFKSKWKKPFSPEDTVNMTFKTFSKEEIRVPMMQRNLRCGYIDSVNYQAVKLPLNNGELSMVIYLPRALDGLKHVEERFSPEIMDKVFRTLRNDDVSLSLPRFKVESNFSLKKNLAEMGMERAFSAKADFSEMADGERLKKIQENGKILSLADVLNAAFLTVDEGGIEAPAPSPSEIQAPGAKSGRSHPLVFIADHPFLFLIYHEDSGTILFMGRILKP